MKNLPTNDDAMIVIIANRGPHDFVWENGQWIAKRASGGLVSMIEPLARQPNVAWFCCVSEPPGSEAERGALYTTAKDQTDPELDVVPVPLPAELYHDYYGEISNEVLWMLQHHLAGQFGCALDEKRHRAWESYLEASHHMAEAIVATEIPVRAFLLQDYHLYPLPALLRERFPETPSLHFIHIPFPDPAVMKLLPAPWREAILRGLLGADVVGLQTPGDVRSFLACCEELSGVKVDFQGGAVSLTGSRTVRVRAFPASTDPAEVVALQESAEVASARRRIRASAREWNVVRVDRLDPSKNQLLGFSAFGRLLETRPELHGRIRFLAFLIPSRTDLTVYREYHDAVLGEIARINDAFRDRCGFDPIEVFYTNDRAQAFAAMEMCDVLLVNSRQDGMNLVVKEWAVLSQKPGVLIVSETAGVASETGDAGLRISALDIEGTTAALGQALDMPIPERAHRVQSLRARVHKWTARDWLAAQLQELGLPPPPPAAPRRAEPGITPATIECELTVTNREGIHARPAVAFVRCVREFRSEMEILLGGKSYPANSILGVLTANLNCGTTFTLRATGSDAQKAVESIRTLLAGFRD